MKQIGRILSIALIFCLLLIPMAIPAEAVNQEYNFVATVGETTYLIILSDKYDEITNARIYNGVIPGLTLDVAGDVTLGLVGEPTTDGEFSVFIELTTKNTGTQQIRVNVTVSPASGSVGTPIITKNPTPETVVEGESAIFIARATGTRQYIWELGFGDCAMECSDIEATVGEGVKVTGYNTEKLVISNIPLSMDGSMLWCRFVGAEETVYSEAVLLTVIPKEDATPVVTKNPTDETVEEGGEAIFVARADYAQEYLWRLVSPDGIKYDCVDSPDFFGDLQVSGEDTERLVLKNIPLELDGYRVYCRFTAGDTVSSELATLHVTENPDETPAEEPEDKEQEEEKDSSFTSPVKPSVEGSKDDPSGEKPQDPPAEEQKAPPAEEQKDSSPEETKGETKGETGAAVLPAGKDSPSKQKDTQSTNSGLDRTTILIIVAIIAVALVAISGIAAFVILKLKSSGR